MDDLPSEVDYQNLAEKIEDQTNRQRVKTEADETEIKGTYDCSDFVR